MSYVRMADLKPLLEPRTVFVPRVPGLQGDMETIRKVGQATAKRTGAEWVTFPGGLFYDTAHDSVGIV